MGGKKKRRKLREQQAARTAKVISEIAIATLAGILSSLITAVIFKLLGW